MLFSHKTNWVDFVSSVEFTEEIPSIFLHAKTVTYLSTAESDFKCWQLIHVLAECYG